MIQNDPDKRTILVKGETAAEETKMASSLQYRSYDGIYMIAIYCVIHLPIYQSALQCVALKRIFRGLFKEFKIVSLVLGNAAEQGVSVHNHSSELPQLAFHVVLPREAIFLLPHHLYILVIV